ncbi:MAG TPA: hypothetical protein VF092_12950 [Longimicrobium sp.]
MAPDALTNAHPDDGLLLRLMDGEADPAERADAARHVETCIACRERMARVRLRRERLTAMLAAADFPIPGSIAPASAKTEPEVIPLRARRPAPARPRATWLRAAATIVLLLAAAAMATPARAWIAQWLGARWAAITHRETTPRPAPAPAPAAPVAPQTRTSAQVRFVPAGSELRVDVAHPQAAGALTLVPVAGPSAGAEVVGGDEVNLLVIPAGVRIGNADGTVASYRITVPEAVRRVRVRIAGGGEVVVPRAEIGGGRTIPLAR